MRVEGRGQKHFPATNLPVIFAKTLKWQAISHSVLGTSTHETDKSVCDLSHSHGGVVHPMLTPSKHGCPASLARGSGGWLTVAETAEGQKIYPWG